MEGISLSTASRFKLSFAEETPPKLRASQLREDQHVKEELVKEEREEPAQDWSVPEAGATNGRTRSMKL